MSESGVLGFGRCVAGGSDGKLGLVSEGGEG